MHVPKDQPGVGQFNANEFNSLSDHTIQGGAPNNFTILSHLRNPFIRDVKVKETARMPATVSPSKFVFNCSSYERRARRVLQAEAVLNETSTASTTYWW